jgi:formylglycine-generating enzyme required for sulfatase activity
MAPATYANFDVLIDRSPAGYRARVIQSPAGEAAVEFALPFSQEELGDFLWRAGGDTRHLGAAEAAASTLDPQTFGAQLYQAAFAGPVGLCLRRSLDAAGRDGSGLRIRLRLDSAVLDLAALPWETLYAPDLARFLALSDLTPIVRYIELDRPVQPLAARLPLTLLAVISNPSDIAPLDVEQEWQRLVDALSPLVQRRLIALERLEAATLPALQARLRRGPVHLLHFVGHGFFDAAANEGGLVFEDDSGRGERASAETLGMLLHDHGALRLIFLNACQGAQGGRSDPWAGVAQRLVQQGAPAVLAMQFPVSDGAAIALAQAFYQALADGLPADTALSQARKAVAAQGNRQEWATPVLFSRSDDNRLIELPQGDRRAEIGAKPFEPETVYIPGGPFPMGTDDPAAPAWEQPQHPVDLPDFRIGRYPVTVRQYAAFIKDQKDQPAPPGWFNREPPAGRADHPITHVSWRDALAYCAWLSRQTGRRYTLPSEAEWEKAGGCVDKETSRQGDKGEDWRFPWGSEWIDGRCNAAGEGTTAVTAYPAGASGYGVHDLLGNVQEWTRSLWGSQPNQPDYGYPYDPAGGHELADPAQLPAQARLVQRGGSFKSQPAELRCTARGNALPDSRIGWRGFRVAMILSE